MVFPSMYISKFSSFHFPPCTYSPLSHFQNKTRIGLPWPHTHTHTHTHTLYHIPIKSENRSNRKKFFVKQLKDVQAKPDPEEEQEEQGGLFTQVVFITMNNDDRLRRDNIIDVGGGVILFGLAQNEQLVLSAHEGIKSRETKKKAVPFPLSVNPFKNAAFCECALVPQRVIHRHHSCRRRHLLCWQTSCRRF